MSNKNPKHKFATGNKLGGRKPLPEDIKIARNMSYEEMCRTVIQVRQIVLSGNKIKIDDMPLGKRAIFNAYQKLDYRGIKDYEDRLWGKAKENIDLQTPEGITIEFVNRTKED